MYSREQYFLNNLEEIKNMLNNKCTIYDLNKKFKIKYCTLYKYLDKYNIDYEKNKIVRRKQHTNKYIPSSYYIENNIYISAPKLRNKLIKDGLKKNQCECCGLSEWMNKPIPLELHHKDFNHYNNSFDNLEILCSNCHMQKHNYNNNYKK